MSCGGCQPSFSFNNSSDPCRCCGCPRRNGLILPTPVFLDHFKTSTADYNSSFEPTIIMKDGELIPRRLDYMWQ